jgi:hypothetical protein
MKTQYIIYVVAVSTFSEGFSELLYPGVKCFCYAFKFINVASG